MSSNPNTDQRTYVQSMVQCAFTSMYNKETNHVESKQERRGLSLTGNSVTDTEIDERVITIEVRIKK